MKFSNRLVASSVGFAVLLAAGLGLLHILLGMRPDSLPYPPSQGFYSAQQASDLPAGWPFSDVFISHWPNALYFQRTMRAGDMPFWRPLLMSGQPFAANPLNKVWYPPQWLVILLPVTLHLNLMIWAHLVLAGLGMRTLGRQVGLGTGAASVIGVAYALIPRLAAATGAGHLDILYAAAWFPWVLWAVQRAVTGSQAIGRRAARLGIIGAFCFLADIRLSLFIFAAGAIFGVWFLFHIDPAQRRSALWSLLLGAGLITALTAVEWLPLLVLMPYLSRAGLTVQDAGAFSLHPLALFGLIFADRGGYSETILYVGITILVLAAIGLVRAPRRHMLWAMLIVAGGLYALGDQGFLWPVLVKIIPPLLWFRVPARAWIVVIVPLLILAGFGLEVLMDRRQRQPVFLLTGVVLSVIGIVVGIFSAALPLRPYAGVTAAVGLIAMGLVLIARTWLPQKMLPILVGGLIVLDLVWMDVTLMKWLPQSAWLDPYKNVAQALLQAGVTRLYSPDYSLPQQAAAYWNIPTFGGVDPFQLQAYVADFEAVTGVPMNGYSITLPAFRDPDLRIANRQAVLNADKLGEWNVSHVLSSYPLDVVGLNLLRQIDGFYLYENERCPKGVALTWNTSNRFTALNASSHTINLVAWSPGWDAEATGNAVSPLAITIAPRQTITRQYNPPGLVPGIVLSFLGLITAWIAYRPSPVI